MFEKLSTTPVDVGGCYSCKCPERTVKRPATEARVGVSCERPAGRIRPKLEEVLGRGAWVHLAARSLMITPCWLVRKLWRVNQLATASRRAECDPRAVDLLLASALASLNLLQACHGGRRGDGDVDQIRSDFVFLAAVVWGARGPVWLAEERAYQNDPGRACDVWISGVLCDLLRRGDTDVDGRSNLRFNLIGFANCSKTLLGIALLMVTYVRLKENQRLYKWWQSRCTSPAITLSLGVI